MSKSKIAREGTPMGEDAGETPARRRRSGSKITGTPTLLGGWSRYIATTLDFIDPFALWSRYIPATLPLHAFCTDPFEFVSTSVIASYIFRKCSVVEARQIGVKVG